jgi:hypothetical protein
MHPPRLGAANDPIVEQPQSVKTAVGALDQYYLDRHKQKREGGPNDHAERQRAALRDLSAADVQDKGDIRLLHAFEQSCLHNEKRKHVGDRGFDSHSAASWKIAQYIRHLDPEGLEEMLVNVGFGPDAKKFRENDISGHVFVQLTEKEMLDGIGISSLGRRKALREFTQRVCTVPPGSLHDSDLANNENILWSYSHHEVDAERCADSSDDDALTDSETDDSDEDYQDEMTIGGDDGAHWRFHEGPCPRCPWFKFSRYVGPAVITAAMGLVVVTILLMKTFPRVEYHTIGSLTDMVDVSAGMTDGKFRVNAKIYGKPTSKDGTWEWLHTEELSNALVQFIPCGYATLFFLYMFHCKTKFKCAALYVTVVLCVILLPWLRQATSARFCEALYQSPTGNSSSVGGRNLRGLSNGVASLQQRNLAVSGGGPSEFATAPVRAFFPEVDLGSFVNCTAVLGMLAPTGQEVANVSTGIAEVANTEPTNQWVSQHQGVLGWTLVLLCLCSSWYLSLRAKRFRDPRQQLPGKPPISCRFCCMWTGEGKRSLQYSGGFKGKTLVPHGYWWEGVLYCVPKWFIMRNQIPCYVQSFLCPSVLAALCYFCGTRSEPVGSRDLNGRVELCVAMPCCCSCFMPKSCCKKPEGSVTRIGMKRIRVPAPRYLLTQQGLHVTTHVWQDLDTPESTEAFVEMWRREGRRQKPGRVCNLLRYICGACCWVYRSFKWRSIIQDVASWKDSRRLYTFRLDSGDKAFDFSGSNCPPSERGYAKTPYDLHRMEALHLKTRRASSKSYGKAVGFEASTVEQSSFICRKDIVRVSTQSGLHAVVDTPPVQAKEQPFGWDCGCFRVCDSCGCEGARWHQQASTCECGNGRWGHNNFRQVTAESIDHLADRSCFGRLRAMAKTRPELWCGKYYDKTKQQGVAPVMAPPAMQNVRVTYREASGREASVELKVPQYATERLCTLINRMVQGNTMGSAVTVGPGARNASGVDLQIAGEWPASPQDTGPGGAGAGPVATPPAAAAAAGSPPRIGHHGIDMKGTKLVL